MEITLRNWLTAMGCMRLISFILTCRCAHFYGDLCQTEIYYNSLFIVAVSSAAIPSRSVGKCIVFEQWSLIKRCHRSL